MRSVLPALLAMFDDPAAGPVALARVIGTSGATPRDVGSAMVVTAAGDVVGSVSGGCVEAALVHTAQQVLVDGVAVVEHFGVTDPDGFGIGLTCGGQIEVFVERVDHRRVDDLRTLSAAITRSRPIALATTLGGDPEWHVADDSASAWRRLDHDVADLLATGRNGIIGVDDCDDPDPLTDPRPRTFVQSFAPGARLILVGANDFVREVAALGSRLGYHVTIVDARAVFATRARFPEADEVIVDWPHRYLTGECDNGRIGPTTTICIMTHDPKFDVPALRVALSADVGFVGALGSRRTVADRNHRLLDAGVTREQLGRLHSPIGLDLGGHTPTEVAVSIAAQILATRHGASGEPLHHGRGPIHHHPGML